MSRRTEPTWYTELREQWRADGVPCAYCRQVPAPADLTIDHVLELHQGGATEPDNLVPSCRRCNSSKSNHVRQAQARNRGGRRRHPTAYLHPGVEQ